MKTDATARTAPAALKWAVALLSVLFGFLLLWLLGFLLGDIDDLKGPEFESIASAHVEASLAERAGALGEEIKALDTRIQRQREIQQNLKSSMDNARATMEQMMGLHRLSLEQKLAPSETERQALATSQTRFLDAQDRFEQANNEIAQSNQQKFQLNQELESVNRRMSEQRIPATREYQDALRRHRFKIASFKLAFIVPLFILSAWLVSKNRHSPFRTVYFSGLAATFWKVGTVMFEHFPREFFKYIAISAALGIVLAFLVWALRTVRNPGAATLIRRFREAYAQHRCPLCAYPIARGPLQHAVWTRKGPRLPAPRGDATPAGNAPASKDYACPACGAHLYEPCDGCGGSRHSLLPYCAGCGREKAVALLTRSPEEPASTS